MTTAQRHPRGLAQAIERCDFWRRSPASVGGARGHKEWVYFCIFGDDVDLVVNFSLMDRLGRQETASSILEDARVTLLARTADGRWHGDVEWCRPETVAIQAGRIDSRFGANRLGFDNGIYRLDAQLTDRTIGAHLCLQAVARPALTRSIPLGSHDPMHWAVVPRLEVTGEVVAGGRRFKLHRRPAYHDHNWGRFSWGGNFAWEWGIVLGGSGQSWSLVYYRITDRGRHETMAQGALLWRDDTHCRTFRDHQCAVGGSGLLRLGRCLRVPRIMSLAIPGTAVDIPTRLEIEARSGADALDVTILLEDGAQIGLPNDHDDGLMLMTECRGRAMVSGRVRGEPVSFSGHSVVEFNRAA